MPNPAGAPGSIEIYRSSEGSFEFEVRTDAETVWVSADQLVELFQRDRSTISRHLRNVFVDGELDRDSVVADFATTASDGKVYVVTHYNLDVVISVGYRVKSAEGVRFRRWATGVLRRYMIEGAAINERRLEQLGSIAATRSRASSRRSTRGSRAKSSTRRCSRRQPICCTSWSKTTHSRTATSAAVPPCSFTSSRKTARSMTASVSRSSRTTRLPRSHSWSR